MTQLDNRRKKIIYRATYRGFKEADIVLSRFAKAHVPTMSVSEMDEFERLLMQPDHDLYDWIIGAQPLPKQFEGPIMRRLQETIPTLK